jgi:hypothetical protein
MGRVVLEHCYHIGIIRTVIPERIIQSKGPINGIVTNRIVFYRGVKPLVSGCGAPDPGFAVYAPGDYKAGMSEVDFLRHFSITAI